MRLNFDYIQTSLMNYTETSSDYDLNEHLRYLEKKPKRLAGVLIPLIQRPHGIQVILTKRAQDLKIHAGQVSFPGGKFDPYDRNLSRTAIREAKEEIGLDPSNVVILGNCPDYITGTGFKITPIVGKVLRHFHPVPQIEEVDSIFEAPLDLLLQTKSYEVVKSIRNDQPYTFFSLNYRNYNLWGATAKILYGLAYHLENQCS